MTRDGALYDEDFVTWTERQAAELRRLAREGSNLPLDWENLAEEIESLGKRDRREAESLVRLILIHLLKLAFSPAEHPRPKWMSDADTFRFQLGRVFRDSPSLAAKAPEIIRDVWPQALREAADSLDRHGERKAAAAMRARARPPSVRDLWQDGLYPEMTEPVA